MKFRNESGAQCSGRAAFFSILFKHDIPSWTKTQKNSLISRFLIKLNLEFIFYCSFVMGNLSGLFGSSYDAYSIVLDPFFLFWGYWEKTIQYFVFPTCAGLACFVLFSEIVSGSCACASTLAPASFRCASGSVTHQLQFLLPQLLQVWYGKV